MRVALAMMAVLVALVAWLMSGSVSDRAVARNTAVRVAEREKDGFKLVSILSTGCLMDLAEQN